MLKVVFDSVQHVESCILFCPAYVESCILFCPTYVESCILFSPAYVEKCVVYSTQNEDDLDREIEIGSLSKPGEGVDPSHFDLLKVLGQGSFGKVCFLLQLCLYLGFNVCIECLGKLSLH